MYLTSGLVVCVLLSLLGVSLASPAVLGAAADVRLDAAQNHPDFAAPDWRYYHNTQSLLERMSQLSRTCEVLAWDSMLMPDEQGTSPPKQVPYARLTSAKNDNPVSRLLQAKKKTILISFGDHGRELISSEVALRLVELACSAIDEEQLKGLTYQRDRLLRELQRSEIVLVPVSSVVGRVMAETGTLCGRLNANGVDVNRNWDFHFGERDDTTFDEEEKPGPRAFSEVESRAVKALAESLKPTAFVAVHSGSSAIVTPWDFSGEPLIGLSGQRIRSVVAKVAAQHCPSCPTGNARQLFGYHAFGSAADYMLGVLNVPFVMTFEVFGDAKAHHNDCFRMFNPTTKTEFDRVVNQWAAAFAGLSEAIHFRLELEEKGVKESALDSWNARHQAVHKDIVDSAHIKRRDAFLSALAAVEESAAKSGVETVLLGLSLIGLFGAMLVFVRKRIFLGQASSTRIPFKMA